MRDGGGVRDGGEVGEEVRVRVVKVVREVVEEVEIGVEWWVVVVE